MFFRTEVAFHSSVTYLVPKLISTIFFYNLYVYYICPRGGVVMLITIENDREIFVMCILYILCNRDVASSLHGWSVV